MSVTDPGSWFVRYREDGDGRALAEVFDRTAPTLLSIAAHLTGRVQDAEDLVQAAFVTAIEKAGDYDARRPLLPWLAGILAGHARNAARRRSSRESSTDIEVECRDPVLERLVDAEERQAFLLALEGLPSPYREVVRMRMETGRTGQEIGAELRRAPGTVRIQLHRGLQLLRKALPPGILGAVGLATLPERGLAAIKTEVLRQATLSAATTAAVSTAATTTGVTVLGVAMTKNVLAVPAVIVAGVAAWFLSTSFLADDAPVNDPEDAPDAVVAEVEARGNDVAESPDSDLHVRREESDGDRDLAATVNVDAVDLVRVTGRVLEEVNGRPVGGAAVWVSITELRDWGPPTPHTLTAANGTFEFDVPYGDADQVQVLADRYAYLSEELQRPAEVVAVRDGIDVGDLTLKVGTTLRGQVLTHAGNPVANATLMIHQRLASGTFFPASSQPLGRSGPDGRFVLEHVPPTLFTMSRLYAVSAVGIGARTITIPDGQPEMNDIEVHLAVPAEVTVQVQDPEGQLIPGANVRMIPFQNPYVARAMGDSDGGSLWLSRKPELTDLFRRETDAKGEARFGFVPSGMEFTLNVHAEDFVYEHRVIRLVGGSNPAEVVVLQPEVQRRILGHVVTPEGRRLRNARVQRYDWYQSTWSVMQEEVEVDASGNFEFEDILAGTRSHLVVDAPGIAKTPVLVEVPATEDLTDVELVAHQGFVVSGIVRDDEGQPVPGAATYLERRGDDYKMIWATRTQTVEDGAFEIVNATAGEWTLVVGLPEPHEQWRRPALRLTVQADVGHMDVVAEREKGGHALLDVTVVSADTGAPLKATRAWYRLKEQDGDGFWNTFSLEVEPGRATYQGAKVGECVLHVEAPGHAAVNQEFTVYPADRHVRLRAELGRMATVRGRVLLGDLAADRMGIFADRDCQSVEPSGAPQTGVTRRYARLDGTEEFHFVEVDPGPLTLTLVGTSVMGSVTVDVESGQDHVVEIHPEPAGELSTRGADGYDSCHLRVYVWRADGSVQELTLASPGEEGEDESYYWPVGRFSYEVRHSKSPASELTREDLTLIREGVVVVETGQAGVIDIPMP